LPKNASCCEALQAEDYSARKSKYFIWEDDPAESTTKQFIKDLMKASASMGSKP